MTRARPRPQGRSARGLGRRALACLLAAAAVALCLGLASSARPGGAPGGDASQARPEGLPDWAPLADSMLASDLDGDGLPEAVEVKGGHLVIYGRPSAGGDDGSGDEGTPTSGTSPSTGGTVETSTLSEEDGLLVCSANADWLVSSCLVGDVDHEGTAEVVLLVWAPGSYGPSKPFWVTEDTDEYREHVYVLRYREGRLVPLWMSSALGVEVTDARLDALDRLRLTCRDGEETCWAWESWGLKLVEDAGRQAASTQAATLVAVGDNIAHRNVLEGARGEDGSYDFGPVYDGVASWVSDFDLAVVGQEAPLLERARIASPVCGAPYAMGDALAAAGFDVVLNATNHVGDFGWGAVTDELAFWEGSHPGVIALGVHGSADERRYELVSREGVTFALFDYTQSTGRSSALSDDEAALVDRLADERRLAADLARAEGEADVSVCFLHTGPEGQDLPDDEQLELCERLVDDGADVIVCAHSHTVMPFARVSTAAGAEGLVYYGLGDFVSGSRGVSGVLGAAATVSVRVETVDGRREASVECSLVPLVRHLGPDGTRVRLLAGYTDDLARENVLLAGEGEDARTALVRRWLAECMATPGT